MIQLLKKHEILSHIAPYLPNNPIIIEAGAFTGGDTIKIAQHFPQATIHAFEPVPYLFERLQHNTASYTNVQRYPYALSTKNGTAPFHLAEKPENPGTPSQAGSLLRPQERLQWSSMQYNSTITVPTTTIDSWADEHHIDHIDCIWLDTQGFSLPILQAGPRILSTVKVLFIEVEFIQAYEGQYQYHEVRQWLEHRGFHLIGKTFNDETSWFFGEALFVRQPIV